MYQALYRKYRPQTFSDVVGQKSITETLRAQVMTGKLSHAYLFTGTRGTGKTSCAKILAKAVNCLDPQDGNPCNHCAACRAIDEGRCMDVLEIDAASNNGVDSVRVLRDDAIYTPGEVRKRVYIIDEVHMLSLQAFNALLKIIEEPPEHLLFILATTELHKVPATILSRCQRYAFRRLLPEDIASRINYVAYQENISIEPDAARLLARLADGALRDGLSLFDQCACAASGTVDVALVCSVLGLAGQRQAGAILTAVADQDAPRALSLFSELYAAGKDLAALFDELLSVARDLLMLKTAPKAGLSMLSGAASDEELLALRDRLSAGELLRMVSLLQQTASGFSRSQNRRVDAELCLLQLCRPSLSLDAQALSARIGHLEEQLANGVIAAPTAPAPSPAPAQEAERPAETETPQDAPAEPVQEQPPAPQDAPPGFWPELAAALQQSLSPRERGFLSVDGPVRVTLAGDTLQLVADNDFVLEMIRREDVAQVIRSKASAILKRPVAVRFARKGQTDAAGHDPMDALVRFGEEHPELFTIK